MNVPLIVLLSLVYLHLTGIACHFLCSIAPAKARRSRGWLSRRARPSRGSSPGYR